MLREIARFRLPSRGAPADGTGVLAASIAATYPLSERRYRA
jgi:hypothetical protein